jgi:hypothetical protein
MNLKVGFNVPIALFNFNRPDLTRKVFEVVRQIKPQRLLLVVDGPRKDRPDDARLCAEVRDILDEVDWDCEISRNFSETNMGSFKRNSSGLNWVFETVEEAIILEDDCIPSLSFFPYCAELLERYRNDTRIGVISGNCFVPPSLAQSDTSYFFSAYPLTWGWASWRHVWKQIDLSMSWWEPETKIEMLSTLHQDSEESEYWIKLCEAIRSGKQKNAWDYQLIMTCFLQSQFCVVPRVNLISNAGYGDGSTHCIDSSSLLANLPTMEMDFPLKHPVEMWRSSKMDHAIFQIRFDTYVPPTLTQKIITKIAPFIPAAFKIRIKKWVRRG